MINPFKGLAVTGDWEWHVEHHIPIPGTDYKTPVGYPIIAASAGRLTYGTSNGYTAGRGLMIEVSPSVFVNYREVASIAGAVPRDVTAGQVIGHTGKRYAHIDARVNGKYVPFETLLTVEAPAA